MTLSSVASARARRGIALFVIFLGLVILLQYLSGAYHTEFSGYPDESAHYVTSLMVRDFIANHDFREPVKFAKDYYDHYPKVAFGHWPPLLYVILGPWMLLFSPARASVLIALALLTTALALLTFGAVRRHFGWFAGLLAGLLLICLPIVQIYSDEVMAESLLAVVTFGSALCFARYLETERWQDAARFGVLASLAILTKGSGWDLALVPPVALVLTKKLSLLTRWQFWIPAVLVAVLCGPWQMATFSIAQRGWDGGDHPNLAYTLFALKEFGPAFAGLLGWGLTLLVLVGVVVTVVLPFVRSRVQADWAVMFALIVAAWVFHSVVPAGVEERKLIVAVPAVIMFLFAGGSWTAQKLRCNPAWIIAACLLMFGFQKFRIPSETHYGYSEAARFISTRKDLPGDKILVSSEHDGEGMLISELAMCERRPSHRVLRGTKVLSRTDWNGHVFECFYQTPEALMSYLKKNGVGIIVSDTLTPVGNFPHQRVLAEAIERYPNQLRLVASFKGDAPGAVSVYRVD